MENKMIMQGIELFGKFDNLSMKYDDSGCTKPNHTHIRSSYEKLNESLEERGRVLSSQEIMFLIGKKLEGTYTSGYSIGGHSIVNALCPHHGGMNQQVYVVSEINKKEEAKKLLEEIKRETNVLYWDRWESLEEKTLNLSRSSNQ